MQPPSSPALPSRAFSGGLATGLPASGGMVADTTSLGGNVPAPSSPETRGPVEVRPTAATGHRYPATADQPLGSRERQRLGFLASAAWRAACAADPDLLPIYISTGVFTKTGAADDWRHSQCRLATADHPAGQIGGISEATRAHYKDIEAHFAALGGDMGRAFPAALQTGDDGWTLRADSKQAAWVFKTVKAEAAAAGLHPNYVQAIANGKFNGGAKLPLSPLTAKQMWQLIYTIRNRASAKLGKGKPASRNKSQRKQLNTESAEDAETEAGLELNNPF